MLCLQNVYELFLNWKSGFHPSSVSLIYRSPSRFQRKSVKCHALVKYNNKKTFLTNLPVFSFNTCFIRYSLFKKQCQIFTSCSFVWGLLLTFFLAAESQIPFVFDNPKGWSYVQAFGWKLLATCFTLLYNFLVLFPFLLISFSFILQS